MRLAMVSKQLRLPGMRIERLKGVCDAGLDGQPQTRVRKKRRSVGRVVKAALARLRWEEDVFGKFKSWSLRIENGPRCMWLVSGNGTVWKLGEVVLVYTWAQSTPK